MASRVFIADDGSNYHHTVTGVLHVPAPPLPPGWAAAPQLLSVVETVTHNGTGMSVDVIRTITTAADSIDVTATLTAPATVGLGGGLAVGDVNDPANRRSIFQARYALQWRPRLAAAPVTVRSPSGATEAQFGVVVENVGPDPVRVTSAAIQSGDPQVFSMTSPVPATVQANGHVTLQGRFSPPSSGHYRAQVVIGSDDPAGEALVVQVDGATADTSGRLRVRVQPPMIPLDR